MKRKSKIMQSLVLLLLYGVFFLPSVFAQMEAIDVKKTSDDGHVMGRIECEDRTMTFGYVAFFVAPERMPNPSRYWMSADYVFPLQPDGSFDVALPEGKYYALAVNRAQNDFGPIEAGEYFYYFMDSKGPIVIDVKNNDRVDLGFNKMVAMPSNPFIDVIDKKTGGVTMIEGFVRDGSGNPVVGVLVVAHISMSRRRPDFISGRSDSNGYYELRLPGSGSYYLIARSRLGRPPEKGDYQGGIMNNMPVTVKTGETVKVDITVTKVEIR